MWCGRVYTDCISVQQVVLFKNEPTPQNDSERDSLSKTLVNQQINHFWVLRTSLLCLAAGIREQISAGQWEKSLLQRLGQ